MKAALVLSILLVSGAAAFGQTPAETYAPAGITIVKYSAHPISQRREWDSLGSASAENQTLDDLRTPPRDSQPSRLPIPAGVTPPLRGRDRASDIKTPGAGEAPIFDNSNPARPTTNHSDRPLYEYAAHIKNLSDKTITAVAWEYWFIQPDTGAQIDSRKFKSVRRLAPGKTVTLNAASYGPRVVSAAVGDKKRKQFDERVVIRCLVYSDGQVLGLGSSSATDCDNLTTH